MKCSLLKSSLLITYNVTQSCCCSSYMFLVSYSVTNGVLATMCSDSTDSSLSDDSLRET